MRNFKIAASVAAVLGASSAFALAPGAVTNINLTIAGSSAFRDSFPIEFAKICQGGAAGVDTFKANAGDNPDFRAYSCTLLNGAPLPALIQGKTATVWYRSEAGSIMGTAPLAKNLILARLDNSLANCGGVVQATPFTYTCPIVGFNSVTDAATSGVTYAKVQLGVSDVAPSELVGENWGTQFTFLGTDPGATAVNAAVKSTSAIGQVFSIVVSKAGPTATVTNLRRQDVTSIFSGAYSDWNQVPDGTGVALGSGAITVCRRDTGSGTQASASIYFNGTGCSSAAYKFVKSPTGPLGNPVVTNLSTTDVKTCINTAFAAGKGAIGIVAAGNTPTNGATVTLDGIAASNTNAALGTYQYYMESTLNTPNLYAVPALETSLSGYLTTQLATNATAPAKPSIVSLPAGPNSLLATLPLTVSGTGVPVALGSKSGNNCLALQNQN